ncbi:MAG: Hsp20/alpha crystallin family protein [Candidatus Komeilibacteria bacterium]|nr:Hsp20/alpha crystallin family protein [Candidatus Komeilibacteria bacterium]
MFKLSRKKKKEVTDQDQPNFLEPDNQEWISDEDYEGQLSVDVYENEDNIVIKSTIAGVRNEDIDISVSNEMVTIKGRRQQQEDVPAENYFTQECYWGGFSRSVILPVEIQADKVNASLKNGVLKIELPKAAKSKEVSIKVKTED